MIERLTANDWERFRAIRLKALADAPDAFGSTLEEESRFSFEKWQERFGPKAANFVATSSGKDIGLITGAPYDECAGLYAMWVAPENRAKGVGGALVDAVIEWAHAVGHSRILLDVGDHNLAAIALYRSREFVPTGVVGVLRPSRQEITEHQMALEL